MKKFLLPLLFFPLMFGVISKNSCKTDSFSVKSPSFSIALRQNDEHPFLDEWVNFRDEHKEICDVSKAEFQEIYSLYINLSKQEKEYVNAQPDVDKGYTIGQVIRSLISRLYPNNSKVKEEKQKLDQSSIIIIATVVALVGATAISVLYILKNNKVIK